MDENAPAVLAFPFCSAGPGETQLRPWPVRSP